NPRMGIAVQQNVVPQLVGRLPGLMSDHLGRPMPNAEFHGVTVRRRFLSSTPASEWFLNRQQHATLISTAQKWGQKRADQYLPLAAGPGACTSSSKNDTCVQFHGIRGNAELIKPPRNGIRSEEHTSELQSRFDLVCRLLLEKKKINIYN